MSTLLLSGLSNAVLAALLALAVAALGRLCRRPALVHSLWLLVLLKLVTPPLLPLPVPDWLSVPAPEPVAWAPLPVGPAAAEWQPPAVPAFVPDGPRDAS